MFVSSHRTSRNCPSSVKTKSWTYPKEPKPISPAYLANLGTGVSGGAQTVVNEVVLVGVGFLGAGAGPVNRMPLFFVGVSFLGAGAGPVNLMALIFVGVSLLGLLCVLPGGCCV